MCQKVNLTQNSTLLARTYAIDRNEDEDIFKQSNNEAEFTTLMFTTYILTIFVQATET